MAANASENGWIPADLPPGWQGGPAGLPRPETMDGREVEWHHEAYSYRYRADSLYADLIPPESEENGTKGGWTYAREEGVRRLIRRAGLEESPFFNSFPHRCYEHLVRRKQIKRPSDLPRKAHGRWIVWHPTPTRLAYRTDPWGEGLPADYVPGSEKSTAPRAAGVPKEAPRAWPEKTHSIFCATPLTAADPRAVTPRGFKGELWAPQATLVKAMETLEARQVLHLEPYRRPAGGAGPERVIPRRLEVRAALVGEPFSFGKTVAFVALICATRTPRAYPAPLARPAMDCDSCVNYLEVARYTFRGSEYAFDCKGRASLPLLRQHGTRLIRATLVIAASSVISQWERILEDFAPSLRYDTIDDVRGLRRVAEALGDPDPQTGIAALDVILMKAGKVTTSFVVPGEGPLEGKQRPLTVALRMLTEGYVWARVVIDDYDTIPFMSDDVLVPALFTWVISATRRRTTALSTRRYYAEGKTPGEYIRANSSYPILGFSLNDLYENVLKLRCDPAYVEAHISTTRVRYRRIKVAGGNAVRLLQDLGVDEAILEMAAAGAVETAAERLGIKASSVGDLVGRVLRKRLDKYRKAARLHSRAARVREAAEAPGRPEPDPRILAVVPAAIEKASEAQFAALLGHLGPSKALRRTLEAVEARAAKGLETYGGQLQRMRDNIREGDCQVCMLGLEGECYVVNCCQTVICGDCTLVGSKKKRRFITRCPNCARDVRPKEDLIFIGEGLDLEASLDDRALLEGEEEAPPEPDGPAGEPPGGPGASREAFYKGLAEDPRLRALLQFALGDPVECLADEEVPAFVTGLLEGKRDAPPPPGTRRKIIIAAMHSESTAKISRALAEAEAGFGGPRHVVFQGTRKRRDAAVAEYEDPEGAEIFLLTSAASCSGLHLPWTTHFVEYHRHVDTEIAKQLIGRAQRVGRTVNLEVIALASEGEADRLW